MASHDYRPDIDGLRAFAIIPVLFFHAGVPGLDGGFVGVDVFFVISGYLISRLIYRGIGRRRFSIIGFYERRARRIVAAFFAVSLLTFLAAVLFLFPTRLVEFCKSLLWSSLAAGNIYFWQESGYFGPEADTQPLLHFWSLGVEEQFYFLFPALALLIWRWGKARLGWVLVAVSILSLVAAELMVRHSPEATFLPVAVPGMGAAVGQHSGDAHCAAPIVRRDSRRHGDAWRRDDPGCRFLLLGRHGLSRLCRRCFRLSAVGWQSGAGSEATRRAKALAIAPLVYVGRISYSLYLVHWPVLFFANRLMPDADPTARTAIVVAVSIAAG